MPGHERTDEELLTAYIQAGEATAIESLLERHTSLAWSIAFGTTRSEALAEDAVQEAWLHVLRGAHTWRSELGSVRAWLAKIVAHATRNVLRTERRRTRREEVAAVNVQTRTIETPNQAAEQRETAAALRSALSALPESERVALILSNVHGFTQQEVASVLEIPRTTAAKRMQRGLESMRRTLTGAGFGTLALVPMLAKLKLSAPPAPVTTRLARVARTKIASAQTAAGAAKGGLTMKAVLGVVLAGAVAAGVGMSLSKKGEPPPLPAEAPPAKTGHKDFEHTTLGGKALIEHAAFSGSFGQLDGPASEGSVGAVAGVDSDTAGNLYIYDMKACAIRAVRRRDGRLFTITGNRDMTFGSPVAKTGPADELRLVQNAFIDMPTLAAVGNPLEGDGSLYFGDNWAGVVVRLWRKDGVWQYEVAGGNGKTKPAAGVRLVDASLTKAGVVATLDGRLGVLAGGKSSRHFYWVEDGVLQPAYDQAAVIAKSKGFYCHGIDGKGNFAGLQSAYTGESHFWVVSADGAKVSKIVTPYVPKWIVMPDRKYERWFFRGMDDYGIQCMYPDGTPARFGPDGVWRFKSVGHRGAGNEGGKAAKSLNWSRGNSLLDGRFAGWANQAGAPVFTATWLDEGR